MNDQVYMAQALRLAEQGLYSAHPNPRVGCVIVAQQQVVGEGWHVRAGEPHAEVHALRQAGALVSISKIGRSARGGGHAGSKSASCRARHCLSASARHSG